MKRQEQAASERRREYERVRSIALCSHVFSPLASLVKLARRAKVTSQFLLIPAFCGLFVCQAFSAVIVRQIWPRKKRILEHYTIICTRKTTFPFNQQYRNDGKSNLPPERRKNDPHAQERRKKPLSALHSFINLLQ